jgi:hypothetical protein
VCRLVISGPTDSTGSSKHFTRQNHSFEMTSHVISEEHVEHRILWMFNGSNHYIIDDWGQSLSLMNRLSSICSVRGCSEGRRRFEFLCR